MFSWGFFSFGEGGNLIFDITSEINVTVKNPYPNQRKYVQLTSKDIALLKFIEEHRLVARTQLYQLLTDYFGVSSNRTAFLDRWSKLEDFKLVDSKKITLNQLGSNRKILRLTSVGVEVLRNLQLLPSNYNETAIQNAFDKKHWDHTLAIREMVVRGLVGARKASTHDETKESFVYQDVETLNPFYHPFIHPQEHTTLVLPDWLLRFRTEFACLEVDTGSESYTQIQKKIQDYLSMVSCYPEQTFTVVIGVIDNSFATQRFYGDDRSIRVANLKDMIIERHPIFLRSPLEIMVCSLARTTDLIPATFAFYPLTKEIRAQRMRFAQRYLSRLAGYPFEHEMVENLEQELDRLESVMGVRADWMIREVDCHTRKTFLSVFIMLREGDVKSLGRLLRLAKKDGWEEVLGIGRVYGVYQNEVELLQDIVPNKLDNHVYFSSVEILRQPDRGYYLYQRASSSKLVGVSL